jgi:hypothetical protein
MGGKAEDGLTRPTSRPMVAVIEDENVRSRLVENGGRIVQQILGWGDFAAHLV